VGLLKELGPATYAHAITNSSSLPVATTTTSIRAATAAVTAAAAAAVHSEVDVQSGINQTTKRSADDDDNDDDANADTHAHTAKVEEVSSVAADRRAVCLVLSDMLHHVSRGSSGLAVGYGFGSGGRRGFKGCVDDGLNVDDEEEGDGDERGVLGVWRYPSMVETSEKANRRRMIRTFKRSATVKHNNNNNDAAVNTLKMAVPSSPSQAGPASMDDAAAAADAASSTTVAVGSTASALTSASAAPTTTLLNQQPPPPRPVTSSLGKCRQGEYDIVLPRREHGERGMCAVYLTD
jgi:hypothetical protein